jgi:hypothetical protein
VRRLLPPLFNILADERRRTINPLGFLIILGYITYLPMEFSFAALPSRFEFVDNPYVPCWAFLEINL